MKRPVAALALAAALAAPALASPPSMVLRGIASGSHPFALMEVDHSTYLLGVGDTIDGKTIRSIGAHGVRLTDGTMLHVAGGGDEPVAGTTSLRTGTPHARRVASGEQTFYENDTDVDRPSPGYAGYGNADGYSPAGTTSGFGYGQAPYYGGYGYTYPGLGYSGYPYDGYGYGARYRARPYRPNGNGNGNGYGNLSPGYGYGNAYGFGAGYGSSFVPGRYTNPGLTTYGHSRAR